MASVTRFCPSGGTLNREHIAWPIAQVIISTPAFENRDITSTEKVNEDLESAVQSKVPCCAKAAFPVPELWGTSCPAILQRWQLNDIRIIRPRVFQTVDAETIRRILSRWYEVTAKVDFDAWRLGKAGSARSARNQAYWWNKPTYESIEVGGKMIRLSILRSHHNVPPVLVLAQFSFIEQINLVGMAFDLVRCQIIR